MSPALSGSPYSPSTRALMRQAGPGGLLQWVSAQQRLTVVPRGWRSRVLAHNDWRLVLRVSQDGERLDPLHQSRK